MLYFFLVYVLCILVIYIFYKLTIIWCTNSTCLIGKTAIITGGDSGMGYETALDFAKRGARVIITSLEIEIGLKARDKIIAETDNKNIVVKPIDLASFKSVRKFAKDINDTEDKIDILVNNAGVGHDNTPLTEDGIRPIMQINYFSMFLLTHLLLDKLKKAENARIVNISSLLAGLEKLNFSKLTSGYYHISKLCVILFTRELAKKLKDSNVTVYSVYPGCVHTSIFLPISKIFYVMSWFCMTAKEGAQTAIYLATEKNIEHLSGSHFHDCYKVWRYWNTYDDSTSIKLWEETEKILNNNENNLHCFK